LEIDTIRKKLDERFRFVREEEDRLRALRAELHEKLMEPAERGQQEQELSQINSEIENLENESVKLREALARADAGSYGMCRSCGRDIESTRLDAIPWTELCIDCAQAQETGA
jgi:DnaK suppressor protein